jgi:hypothetical protein
VRRLSRDVAGVRSDEVGRPRGFDRAVLEDLLGELPERGVEVADLGRAVLRGQRDAALGPAELGSADAEDLTSAQV